MSVDRRPIPLPRLWSEGYARKKRNALVRPSCREGALVAGPAKKSGFEPSTSPCSAAMSKTRKCIRACASMEHI
eukprot:96477-Chlamydomonas_euryale.AAC.1